VRLLFIGDAAATGFGTVTFDLGKAMLDRGVDVRFLSMNIQSAPPPEPIGSRTYPVQPTDRPDVILSILRGSLADGWVPEAILMVSDYYSARWVTYVPEVMEALARVPAFHYVPIEGIGTPRNWRELWDTVRPITMTRFGQAEVARVMGYEPPMVYHGVDQETFYPIAPNRPSAFPSKDGGRATNKASAKVHFGVDPNRVMLLRTDRYMPRKMYASLLRSVMPVMAKRPEVDLVLHCSMQDHGGDMNDLLGQYPQELIRRVYFTLRHDTFTGMDREELNLLYNAADLYVSSGAEGFGLCLAESIAAGTPVLALDYSAVPEVVGPAGQVIAVGNIVDNEYGYFWARPDEPAFSMALDRLVTKPALRRSLGSEGPKHVAANFSWARAAEQFDQIIQASLVAEAA
jgi:glycosyltransferase involved in cell wall biosynthesis